MKANQDKMTADFERFLENYQFLRDDVGFLLGVLARLPGKVNWPLIEERLKAPECKRAVAELIENDPT